MAFTPQAGTDLLLSIREQIPDRTPGDDPLIDGNAFSANTLIRWINDAGRVMCLNAPIIQDWYALSSIQGQDVYILPNYLTTVEQVWYDLLPLNRQPEADGIFPGKLTGQSWSFGPHAIHAIPRLFVWPAPSRTGGVTTLNGAITATANSLTLTAANFQKPYGFLILGPDTSGNIEVARYANISGTAVTNILRGQGGTLARAWPDLAPINEGNLFFKCYRLPVPLTKATDTVEIPQGLWPLIELYVLAKVKSAEQDAQSGSEMMKEFLTLVDKLSEKGQLKGLRQGFPIKTPEQQVALWMGRIYIP